MVVFYAASRRLAVRVLAALMFVMLPASSSADEATEKALKEQLRLMQQRMEDLAKEVNALNHQVNSNSAAPTQPPPLTETPPPAPMPAPGAVAGMPPPPPKSAEAVSREPLFEHFLKGFYDTLDVSFDDVTKGINGLTAYEYSLADPTNPNSGYVQGPRKDVQQVGRLGYLPSLSTNKSQIGYRNTHRIGDTRV